jgi:DNA polymerase I
MKTLIIDGQWNLKRNFYKRKELVDANYRLCGGTYGFLDSTKSVMNKILPDRVVTAWDGFHAGKLRYNIYKPYKANRQKDWENETRMIATDGIGSPEDAEQFQILSQKIEVQKYLDELFVRQIEEDYIEADDLIAYYVLKNQNPNEHFYIYSRDQDFFQLISENVSIINPDSLDLITIENFKDKFGYTQENALLFKCFKGDDSDDIPGIHGIGVSTLLKHFPDMANEKYTYKRLVEECYEKQKKKKLKTYEKIIQAEQDLYRNAMLMNLRKPFLNESAINSINALRNQALDSSERSIETAMEMFARDGFNKFVGDNNIGSFFGPFYSLKAKEKEFEAKLA